MNNSFVFLHESFYNKLGLRSNYNLFFCSNIRNLNKKLVKISGKNRIEYTTAPFRKVNMYSIIEDSIAVIKGQTFIPKVSLELLKTNLFGYSMYKKQPATKEKDRLDRIIET